MTPREIKDRKIRFGIGYSRKDTNNFISQLCDEFEALYKENDDLRDKINILSEGLQYYKSMEKTMQKAMVIAQKACDEKQEEALKRAKNIEKQAELKASEAISAANLNLDKIYSKADELNRKFMLYKSQIKDLLETQMQLINSDIYDVAVNDLEEYIKIRERLNDTSRSGLNNDFDVFSEKKNMEEAGKIFKKLTREFDE